VTVPESRPARGAAPTVWGNVPQRIKNFTGRQDILDQLRDALDGGPAAVLPQALQGWGGVGKTAVAIEYAHRYRSEYDLVWWIPADQPTLVPSSLAALAGPLGLQPATAAGIEITATAVLDALRRGDPYSRWLLIFDNADQPDEINEIIPRGPGDVLITSRNPRWDAVVATIPVNVFTRGESTDFLAKRVPKPVSDDEANRLAEELGDLPLALEQAGALQAETGMSVDEYLRLLKEHAADIMAEGKAPEYPRSMTAAWKLSVSTLSGKLPEAVELLRCCAFLGPEFIPRDVFHSGSQAWETRVGDLLADPILLARVIRELGRFALVRINGRAIQVHRLIQALLRDELGPDERASYQHEAHLILAAGAPASPDDDNLWPRYAELVPHVAAANTDLVGCQDLAVRNFALDVVRYLYRSGDPETSRSFAERFIARWTEDSGPDAVEVLNAQRHLGNALRERGEYQAAYALTEATLRRTGEIAGAKDPLTLALRNSFAADLRARGDFAAARALDEESLNLHTSVFGPEDPRTLRVMNNLALDHGLNSDYVSARGLEQRTFNLRYGAPGATATDMVISWNGLSRAVRLCGDYHEARDVGQDAYDYGCEKLSAEHYWTLRSLIDLSIALRRIGSARDDALAQAQSVYEQCAVILGPHHPDTLAAAINLTNTQRTVGQTDKALALAESTVASYPAIYGPDHPYNHGCASNLGLLRRVTGDPAGARILNEAALAGLDARLTRDHHYSLTVAANLASDLAELGDTAQARTLGEDTLSRLRRLLGEGHPLTLGCAANFAIDLRAEGAKDEAAALSADTMNRYASTLGAEHADAIAAAEGRRLDFDFDPPPI
jgi:tetratricopeptide (TPR) repeat protein